jgi:site-specific DNA-methyltransferase (adenine-specific)
VFAELDAEFHFDLDPCATVANAKCARYFTRELDGLAQPRTGRVFLNPPYGQEIGRWMCKARQSVESGEAELCVCLVPARSGSARWHDFAAKGDVRFLRGRLHFNGGAAGAPFDSAVVVFRNAPARYESQGVAC